MLSITRTGAFAGILAAVSMTATPAAAAELPTAPAPAAGSTVFTDFNHSIYDGEAEVGEWHRWGRRGYRRGWRRNRVDAGDVLTGVLILGGIAAIASAANNNNRRHRDVDVRRDRDYDRDQRDNRRDTQRDNRRSSNTGSGLDNATEQCVSRIERDIRVDSVDGVNRTAEGWTVTGVLFNGGGFSCQIDNNGRIADINYGGFQGSSFDAGTPARARGDDRQWSDDRYAQARQNVQPRSDATSEQLPAYPGGPVPGDSYPGGDYPGNVDADLGG